MPRPITAALSVLVTCWVFVGCGGQQSASDPGRPADSASSRPTAERTTPVPTEEPTEDLTVLPTGKPGKGAKLVLTGTVEPGVEAGCQLLTSGGSTYQLIWSGGRLVDGEQVEVVGTAQPDLMTTCQQGIPFVVERLVPAGG